MTQMAASREGGRRAGIIAVLLAVITVLGLAPGTAAAQDLSDPRYGLEPGSDGADPGTGYTVPNADAETASLNLELLANRPKPAWATNAGAFDYSNIGSDLAFTGDHAISGNYLGFGVFDISDPANPTLETTVNCPGGQGDPSVYGDLLFISVEQTSARTDCSKNPESEVFRGIRIFDISDITNPQYVAGVQTCRGSHTHTLVTDPDDDANVYVYVSGTSGNVRPASQLAGCANPSPSDPTFDETSARWRIDVIKVPVDAPEEAAVVSGPRLMADEDGIDGLWPGGNHGPDTQSTATTDACHDLTAYPEIGLAAGACEGNGLLIDISDPENPVRLDAVLDPNFAYWHSATFNNDGTKVVFTDEWGGGVGARCRTTDPDNWGANAIFDVAQTPDGPRLEFASYYKVPNVQANNETCVAHNGSLVPIPDRDVMVQAWYEGGVSVWDFTESANPVEIAYFDRGPYHPQIFHQGGYWSAYYYDGQIYGNEIFLGFDSFGFTEGDLLAQAEIDAAAEAEPGMLNAQTQSRLTWAPSFAVVRSGAVQLARADGISDASARRLEDALGRAERFSEGPQARAAVSQLDNAARILDVEAQGAERAPDRGDAEGLRALAASVRELADTMR